MDTSGQIFRHLTFFYSLDTNGFQSFTETDQLFVTIEFSSVKKTTGLGEDRSYRIRRGWFALLVHPEVTSHCSVSSFSFHRFSIRSQKDRSHETQRTEALSDSV